MNIEIKKLSTIEIDRFIDLIQLFEEVFEMKDFTMPSKIHLQQLLEENGFFVFVALLNNKVVGGLTAYTLHQYYSLLPQVYIYDVAVATEYQRKGIGKMLMLGITDHCREIGIEEIFVQADEEDVHAIEFYHSTGGIAQKVIHFNYPLNSVESSR